MKYLVVSGCSHSVGTGLKKCMDEQGENVNKRYRYSSILSNKLNLQEINLGTDGGSNWQIYYNVMSWILENPDKINDSIFIISWTTIDRNWLNIRGSVMMRGKVLAKDKRIDVIPSEVLSFDSDNFFQKRQKFKKGGGVPDDFSKFWNESIQKTTVIYMMGLMSFLSKQKLKYLHFHVNREYWNKKYDNLFKKKNYISDIDYETYCNFDIIKPPKYSFFDGHIGPEGQKLWSNYLYEQLLKREII